MFGLIKSNLPFSYACGGVRNLFSSGTVITGCALQPMVQWQRERGPLCVCVCAHACVCKHVGSRERCHSRAMLMYAGHVPMCPGRGMCLAVPTCMCLVDMPVPGLPCGCPWLLAPLEGDAPSSLCFPFSYICKPWPHYAQCPHCAMQGHEHL